MAKFVFQFQAVLEHRLHLEQQRQRELAIMLRKKQSVMDELAQMQETVRASKRGLADGLVGKVDMIRVGQFARFSSQTTLRAYDIVSQLATIEKQIQFAREKLLEAVKAKRVMELLRDKQLQKWKQREAMLESEALDELAVQRHNRQYDPQIPESAL